MSTVQRQPQPIDQRGARPIDWELPPLEVLRRWPRNVPLAALISGDDSPWSRVSVVAAPGEWRALHDRDDVQPRDVKAWIRALDDAADPREAAPRAPNIGPGWLVQFSYELGRVLEPAAQARRQAAGAESRWPLIQAARCERAFAFDHLTRQWWSLGGAADSIRLGKQDERLAEWECPALREDVSDARYADAVDRAIGLIRAGDLFQANIARHWSGSLHGSPRAFAHHALASSRARYGAWLETPAGMLASMSPELFLELDRGRRVIARPIKGTRGSEVGGDELARSGKDAAELHMIVDLMRNDLARTCRPGTVRVREARMMESHGTVVHGVAEIHGELRGDCDRAELLACAFPPGSVTGAPKIRAMQVIDELEGLPRGPYCGAIGYFSDSGAVTLSVAIRTATLRRVSPGHFALDYAAGCGITSDSRADEETAETHAKSRVLAQAIRSPRRLRA